MDGLRACMTWNILKKKKKKKTPKNAECLKETT